MSPARSMGGIPLRTVLVLLAGSTVAAATWALMPHSLPQIAAERVVRLPDPDSDVPVPGSKEALQRAIHEIQKGSLGAIDNDVAGALALHLPVAQKVVTGLGPLQSVIYRGSGTGGDVYRATFQKGSLTWRISLGRGRVITGLGLTASEGPMPQDWINHYLLVPSTEGAARLPLAFLKILALVGVGRLARIRL